MHRRAILQKLEAYRPADAEETASLRRITEFVRRHPDCFERSLSVGHITGAAWLVNEPGDRVLLTHHRKLGKWVQLGGHADGNPDVLAVALGEAREESGIAKIVPISRDIFDVDVHEIAAHNGVPAHLHYDIRFLLQARGDAGYRVSDESHDLAWISPEELLERTGETSMLRMHRKWLRLIPVLSRFGPKNAEIVLGTDRIGQAAGRNMSSNRLINKGL